MSDSSTPWTVAHQASLGIFQARIVEWVAIPFSRKSSLLGSTPAGSKGYPKDERCRREKTCETSLDRAKSAREREREKEREGESERERDQTGGAAESGRVWQCFIFYHSFYTLN